MRKSIVFSILLVGATAMAAQIVLVRELIVIFYGNEISVGIILASWLLLGAIGSLLLGRFADNMKSGIEGFAFCQIFLSAALPLSLILIRLIKKAMGIIPGEIIGLEAMAAFSLVILAPICIVLGFLFALSCRLYRLDNAATQIGKVYILEATGAAVSGMVTSFFLIKNFGSFEILAGLGLLNIAASLFLSRRIRPLSLLWLAAVLVLFAGGGLGELNKKSLELEWEPLKLVSSRNSIYSNLTVTRQDSQVSFFSNGLHNFTVPDELAQEEAVHFAMLEHDRPEEILIVGGGPGGGIREILKYPVKRVDYVELDPLIIEMGKLYLTDAEYFVAGHPRLNVINADARFWIKKTAERYDVIIINLPNPFTAQLNRFYTLEFFREADRIMKPGGVISFGMASSENYISRELGKLLGSIDNTLELVFPDVKIVPGDTAYFLASNRENLINLDHEFLTKRLKERGLDTKFVRDYYLFSKLSDDRLDYINKSLKENAHSRVNRDFMPISYYYDMSLWTTHFTGSLKRILPFLTEFRIWLVLGLVLIILIIAASSAGKKTSPVFTVMTAIGTTGFSEIAFEITVILAFQVIYGFLYYKLGLMLSSFMIGLILGSFCITKRLNSLRDDFGAFIKIQFSIVVYPLILPPIFLFLAGQQNSPISSWLGSNVIFPLLPIVAGFIGGLQFPLGAKIYLGKSERAAGAGGLAYGIDLIGACIGAVIVSGFFVPILGIFKTCLAISVLNLLVLALLVKARNLDKHMEK